MKNMMKWLMEEEAGQGMVEYALIVGLLALVAIVAIAAVGDKAVAMFDRVEATFPPVRVN